MNHVRETLRPMGAAAALLCAACATTSADGASPDPEPSGAIVAVAIPDPWVDDPARRIEEQPTDSLPIRAADPGSRFAVVVADELAAFLASVADDTAVARLPTLTEWVRDHPEDHPEPSRGTPTLASGDPLSDEFEGRWCARSSVRFRTEDGHVVLRQVRFYPPPLPEPARLPTPADEGGGLPADCLLGSITVRTDLEASTGDALAGELRAELSRRFGHEAEAPELPDMYVLHAARVAAWPVGSATVAAVLRARYQANRLYGAAWVPEAGFDLPDYRTRQVRYGDDTPRSAERNLQLIRLAELDEARARDFLDEPGAPKPSADSLKRREAWHARFIDALEAWLTYGSGLDAQGRAATLLIADHAVRSSGIAYSVGGDSIAVRRLADLGVSIENVPLQGHETYPGDLLVDALRVTEATPVGDHAFVRLLARGFHPGPGCPALPAFWTVIERGEAYLTRMAARRAEIDPALFAEAHYRVAKAHADIVAAAAGITTIDLPGEAEGLERQGPYDAETARRSALRHYQAALDEMPASTAKRAIWRDAWRLAAGLPPLEWTFMCGYE